MPEQKDLPISDLELVYLNGQEHGGAPTFKDVRLSRDSQKVCDDLLSVAKQYDKRIRSDNELERVIGVVKDVQARVNHLKWLRDLERKAWVHILSQIDTAITGWEHQFQMAKSALKDRIEKWRTEVEEGRRKVEEDLKRKAEELEQKAQHDSNPQVRRQADVQAKEVRTEAKQYERLEPAPGIATVIEYEYEIENRPLAAKLPMEAIRMECQDEWFNARIKEANALKQPIPTFPGVRVTVKAEVRFSK
jgi:hypothetical protein